MHKWTYISSEQRFTIELPSDWAEYEDEPNVIAFFDATDWTGNLRITPVYLKEPTKDHVTRTRNFIDGILAEHPGAEKIILGSLLCAHYQQQISGEENETLIIYFWLGVYEHHRFACSFTAPAEENPSAQRRQTLKVVEEIISSISITATGDK